MVQPGRALDLSIRKPWIWDLPFYLPAVILN